MRHMAPSTLRVRTTIHPVPVIDPQSGTLIMGMSHGGTGEGAAGRIVTVPDFPLYRNAILDGHLQAVEEADEVKAVAPPAEPPKVVVEAPTAVVEAVAVSPEAEPTRRRTPRE